MLALGMPKERINHTRLYEDIDAMMAQYGSMDFENLQLGPLARKILRILRQHKIAIMPGISMFARGVHAIEPLHDQVGNDQVVFLANRCAPLRRWRRSSMPLSSMSKAEDTPG